MANFRKVKEEVSIMDVMEYYKIHLEQRGKDLVGECPLCGSKALKVSKEKNCWKCFGSKECGGGNIFDFVSKMEKLTIRRSAEFIDKKFHVSHEERKQPTELRENPLYEVGLELDPSRTPFKKETAEYFQAGYCNKGMHRGKVAIPIQNVNGYQIGYVGKEERKEDKYPKDFIQGINVYNSYRMRGKHAYLVSDIYDVWALSENKKQAMALMSDDISQEQINEIIKCEVLVITVRLNSKANVKRIVEKLVPHKYVMLSTK